MLNQIRWRIAIPYIFLIVVMLGGISAYLSNTIRQNELRKLDINASSEALLISSFLEQDLPFDENDLDALAKEWSHLLDTRVTIIDDTGTVLGESDANRLTMDNHLNRPEIQQALDEGIGRSIRFSRTEGIEFMYVAVPIWDNGEIAGFSRVAIPLAQIQEDINLLTRTMLYAAVVAALLAIFIAAIIAELLSRPLRKLTEAIKLITVKDLNLDLPPSSESEIGQLTRAFDTVLKQLKGQYSTLETERLKLQTVLDQLSDSIVIVDSEGLIQMTNPATLKIFKINTGEVVGQSIVKVLREHQIVTLWKSSEQSKESQSMDIDLRSMNLSLLAHAIPLKEPFLGSTMLVFQDVTHIRYLETVRGDFISNISHELRTPLASLKALAETLQDGALDDPPTAHRFLSRMETEVDSLTLMVQELLELARIESGKVPLNLEPISPMELITSAVDRMKLQVERSELTIRIECSGDIPQVQGDYPRMEQVMVNLLHNAIKFTPPGGDIVVSCDHQDSYILFSIADTGIGIPEPDLPRIFERFYKAERSRTGGGTGLGLAIAKHLVEAHNGQIWAESIEGKGSTFYFTIPATL